MAPTRTRRSRRLGALTMVCSVFGCCINADAFVPVSTRQTIKSHRFSVVDKKDIHEEAPVVPDQDGGPTQVNDEVVSSRRSFLKTAATGAVVSMAMVSAPKDSQAANEKSSLNSELLLAPSATEVTVDWQAIVKKASKKALGGGKAGAAAAIVQVCSLMWLRTAMNYQYRYGGNLATSLSALYSDGGIPRLYQGLGFALVQGPATRFFDTASNVGILALLESFDETRSLPLPVKTAVGSAAAGLSRIFLMPVDTSKTAMQVEGADGLERLWTQVVNEGPAPLYQGALASAAATAAGHFPWFLTYNALNANLPAVPTDDVLLSLARNAFMGLCASCVSDCVSNSLRVVKTTKQTASLSKDGVTADKLSYPETVALILETDGIIGLLGRGLQTRLLTNMIQGALFSVLWKYFQTVGGLQ